MQVELEKILALIESYIDKARHKSLDAIMKSGRLTMSDEYDKSVLAQMEALLCLVRSDAAEEIHGAIVDAFLIKEEDTT